MMLNFLGLLKPKTTKVRNFMIIAAIVGILIVLLAIFLIKQPGTANSGKAKLAKVPQDVQFDPGAKNLSKEYLKTLMQSEHLKYEHAVQTGDSAIPTLMQTGDQAQPTGTLLSTQGSVCSPSCYKLLNERYAKYKTPSNLLQQWVKQGRLLPSTAAELNKLDKQSQSADEYARALNQLVKEGKITPAQARALLEAFKKEHKLLGTGKPTTDDLIGQMVKEGALSPADAARLRRLIDQDVPVNQFQSELNHLVATKHLDKAAANKLLKSYRQEKKAEAEAASPTTKLIDQLQNDGKISPKVASDLKSLNAIPVSASDFEKALNRLVDEGKLSPNLAKQLLAAYKTEHPDQSGESSDLAKFRKAQQEREAKERQATAEREAEAASSEKQEARTAAIAATVKSEQAAMSTQIQTLIKAWNPEPQQYVFSEIRNKDSDASGTTTVTGPNGKTYQGPAGSRSAQQIPLIKAGNILFAVLDTAVNSDQPGPVMATIVNGKYKGAKLIGGLKVTPDNERVFLQFTQMSMKNWADVIQIKAVAINPDTARTAIASDVNHHYLLRYGMLFASGFVQGLSQAVSQSGSTDVTDSGTTTTKHPKLNTTEKLYMAVGQVGQQFSDAAKKIYDKKPTIKVDAGVGLGILFTGSVYRYPLKVQQSKTDNKTQKTEKNT